MSERHTVTFTKSGLGVGHASRSSLFPLCGTNFNRVFANPQIQADDWSKVTCQKCLTKIQKEEDLQSGRGFPELSAKLSKLFDPKPQGATDA